MPARAPAKADVLICTTSFVGSLDGVEVAYREGELIDASDPIARKWRQFFASPAAVRRSVEQATAAPGERR